MDRIAKLVSRQGRQGTYLVGTTADGKEVFVFPSKRLGEFTLCQRPKQRPKKKQLSQVGGYIHATDEMPYGF